MGGRVSVAPGSKAHHAVQTTKNLRLSVRPCGLNHKNPPPGKPTPVTVRPRNSRWGCGSSAGGSAAGGCTTAAILRMRPMKDRVREAIFNLIGPAIRGKHAMDLFAGTGALGLEALSRGADRATFIEQHFPTAKIIRQNIAALGVEGPGRSRHRQRLHLVAATVPTWAHHAVGRLLLAALRVLRQPDRGDAAS